MDVVGMLLTVGSALGLAAQWVWLIKRGRSGELLAPALVLFLGMLLFGVAAFDHLKFIAWMQEDRPVEWATVVAFAAAALLCAWRAWTERQGRWVAAGWTVAAASWAFVAGEEFSWGQRILGYATPEALLATNTQLEANLHNSLTDVSLGPIPLDAAFLVGLVAVLLGVVGPLIARRVKDRWSIDWVPLFARGPMAPLLLLIGGLQWWHPFNYGSEATELLLGLSALLVAWPDRWIRRPWLAPLAVVITLGLGAVLAPLLAPADDGPENIELARTELTALAGDMQRGITPLLNAIVQLRHKTYHARVQWTLKRLDVDLPSDSAFLDGKPPAHRGGPGGRRGYFLDPWHSPYWLHMDFIGNRLMVYSFGPNRRRDTMVHTEQRPQVDDIGVALRWPPGTLEFSLEERAPEPAP